MTGKFILFEGLDKTGKSTQAKLLKEYLDKNGKKTFLMEFPNRNTEIGKLIDNHLQKRNILDEKIITTLFCANRWEAKRTIEGMLKEDIYVIVVRYSYSGIAYSISESIEKCAETEKGLPIPDITFYLKSSEADKKDNFGKEIYETKTYQDNVKERFDIMLRKGLMKNIVIIDTNKSINETFDYIKKFFRG